jgi:hypothetical protein
VLSHTDPPQSDSIELLNTSATQVGIAGWYLSDSSDNLFKFAIPNGTLLDVGGYITYNESHFNPTPANPGPNDFGLNGAHGDDVYLMAPTKRGGWYFADHVDFGASKNGESFGRWPNATGKLYPMLYNSWNAATPARVWDRSSSAKSITTPEPCPMRRNSNLSKSTIQPPWLWI